MTRAVQAPKVALASAGKPLPRPARGGGRSAHGTLWITLGASMGAEIHLSTAVGGRRKLSPIQVHHAPVAKHSF